MPNDQQQAQEQDSQQEDSQQQDDRPLTEKPEVTDEHREKAKEMRKEYDEDRPTVALPGSDNTVTGTAVNDWLDDDGNPKFGSDSKDEAEQDAKDES